MTTLALFIGYTVISVMGFILGLFLTYFFWMYLSCAVYHAYIANKAFNEFPKGTLWNKGYPQKKYKFIKLLWNHLCHPLDTIRGRTSSYYAVGHKGLLPTGIVRQMRSEVFTSPVGEAKEEE